MHFLAFLAQIRHCRNAITYDSRKASQVDPRHLLKHAATREALVAGANELFDVVLKGVVKIEIDQTYPLAETAQAHRDLEARKTTGSTVLLP